MFCGSDVVEVDGTKEGWWLGSAVVVVTVSVGGGGGRTVRGSGGGGVVMVIGSRGGRWRNVAKRGSCMCVWCGIVGVVVVVDFLLFGQ